MRKNRIFKKSFLGLAILALAACTNEWDEQNAGVLLKEGEVSVQWLPANMGIKHVQTRASDPKTGEEQKINNAHVFVFGNDGKYLNASGADAFQGYRYVADAQSTVFNTTLFGDQDLANGATIVVLANMPENIFTDTDNNLQPDQIADVNGFADFVFRLPVFTATLPEGGLPMYGRLDDVDLRSTATEKVLLIHLKSLMARIDLDFTMDPYQSSDDGRNPALRIDKVRVGNFPKGGTIVAQTDLTQANKDEGDLQPETVVSGLDDFIGHILRGGEPQQLTLYMFEHGRAAKALGDAEDEDGNELFPTGNYPDGIEPAERQRYKNYLAADDAAYIELEGVYTNHNGYKYAVTYRIYPGGNATDDFTIKSNCQYKNNITVKGITVNNMGREALLDTRVDIDSEANPYFIEMLREREHDAHFCVTPMDVYIYRGGSVKVEIVYPDDHKWIRMEPMKYSPTANGKVHADKAGDGKRTYFETDLVQGANGTDGQLSHDYNKSYTVTSNTSDQTYEERIYFYIDENVPTPAQANAEQVVPDREATLRITYKEADGQQRTHTREIVIRQKGMLPVKMRRTVGDQTYKYGDYVFYIEYYEEYLEHYDGKDLYAHTYDGLSWGLHGLVTGLGGKKENYGGYDGNFYMPYGWRNTMTIMEKFRDNNVGEKLDITLNDKPRSAAEYCYNKNRRDEYGHVLTCHWYLPTIREIEQAMDRYYGTFRVFQNNWYWSSNPGNYGGGYNYIPDSRGDTSADNITWTGEHGEYARATKSMLNEDGKTYSHADSEANKPYEKRADGSWDTPYDPDDWSSGWGQTYPSIGVTAEHEGGYANRDKIFRIRAAYILKVPTKENDRDYDVPPIENTY